MKKVVTPFPAEVSGQELPPAELTPNPLWRPAPAARLAQRPRAPRDLRPSPGCPERRDRPSRQYPRASGRMRRGHRPSPTRPFRAVHPRRGRDSPRRRTAAWDGCQPTARQLRVPLSTGAAQARSDRAGRQRWRPAVGPAGRRGPTGRTASVKSEPRTATPPLGGSPPPPPSGLARPGPARRQQREVLLLGAPPPPAPRPRRGGRRPMAGDCRG